MYLKDNSYDNKNIIKVFNILKREFESVLLYYLYLMCVNFITNILNKQKKDIILFVLSIEIVI